MKRGLRRICGVSLVALVAFVAGCDKVSGKYQDQSGAITVELKSGKATMTTNVLGQTGTETGDYKVDGDKVIITKADKKGEDLTLTIEKDGSLSGPMGWKLTKKE